MPAIFLKTSRQPLAWRSRRETRMSESKGSSYRVQASGPMKRWRMVLHPLGLLARRLVRRVFALNSTAVGFWISESPIVFAAMATLSELKVFDALESGPKTAAELARELEVDEDALTRLLRAVAAVSMLKRGRDDRYALNSVARCFTSSSPRPVAVWSELVLKTLPLFPTLPAAVKAGVPMMRFATGKTCWEFMETLPNGTELHDRSMSAWTELIVDKIASEIDFSSAKTLVDVGGGRGAFLSACLRAAPHLHGTVYDRDNTREAALARFKAQGVDSRAQHVAGNFFESVPPGADLYSIKHALHDWGDDEVRTILKNVRQAIPAHGRLLIVEGAIEHEHLVGNSVRAVWDLTQWMLTWGKERSIPEFQQLLAETGFQLEQVTITPSPDALVMHARPIAA